MIRKSLLFLSLFSLISFHTQGQESNEETLAPILDEAVTIIIHTKIINSEQQVNWESDLKKVTVPGRTVTLFYETDKERLTIELTPFKGDHGAYILAAMSQFKRINDSAIQFNSSFKSIKLEVDELILFYPLGLKAQQAISGGSLNIELSIKITPYKKTKEVQTE